VVCGDFPVVESHECDTNPGRSVDQFGGYFSVVITNIDGASTSRVISWSIIALFDRHSSTIREIKVGYYVWLLAYALLFAAQTIKAPNEPAAMEIAGATAQQ
jgi:hypothetical protein